MPNHLLPVLFPTASLSSAAPSSASTVSTLTPTKESTRHGDLQTAACGFMGLAALTCRRDPQTDLFLVTHLIQLDPVEGLQWV